MFKTRIKLNNNIFSDKTGPNKAKNEQFTPIGAGLIAKYVENTKYRENTRAS